MAYPATPACLCTPYCVKPSQKGGTLIAEEVATLEEHRDRLADVDAYRPEQCNNCGGLRLHAHDFRERRLRADPDTPVVIIRRYDCAMCDAVWQVLPGFLARHLHRRWTVVEAATGTARASPSQPPVPEKTVARWSSRLALSAAQLTQLLLSVVARTTTVAISAVGTVCSRAELADTLVRFGLLDADRRLEQLAGWVHRLMPGVRLM